MLITQFTYLQNVSDRYSCERSKLPSLTVPNQSLTIREILSRSGVLSVSKSIYHDGLDDFDACDPTLRPDFDLSDVTEISREISNKRKQRVEAASELAERSEAVEQKAKPDADATTEVVKDS